MSIVISLDKFEQFCSMSYRGTQASLVDYSSSIASGSQPGTETDKSFLVTITQFAGTKEDEVVTGSLPNVDLTTLETEISASLNL